ncbi:MAG: DUF5134 domain-containing protein [Arthrobacter sp.]|nr:DUF5134 domain-containing protein [Arthrobacter sp.]
MIENDVLRWGLMALLLGASLYAAFRAGRQSPPAIRAGYGLHAAMMIAMVPMLVPGLQWPALPQIVFFALAAWWFILRAVSRRPVQVAGLQVPAAGPGHGRGALLYNALTMAAMACMLAVMDLHGAGGTLAGPEASGLPGQTTHHGGPAVGLSLPGVLAGSAQDWSTQPALVLAPAFGLAAAVWGLLLFRRLRVPGRPRSGDAFLELVGAASMAVMFAALAV